MRVDEELMIAAVAGAQSGKALPGIPVALSITKNDDEAITLEDGVITAVGAGSAEVTAESELAGIAGKLTVTVTKPIDKIVFVVLVEDDDPKDGPSAIVLAAGQMYMDEITAVAHDEDGNVIDLRSNWSWSSTDDGVATVSARKDDDDKLVDMGAHGTITGKGAGDAEIMATAEDVSGSIAVSVTGQTRTRIIRASTSNSPDNTFTWDRNDATPAWDPATISFDVGLYDAFSNDRIAGNVSVVSSVTTVAAVGNATASPTATTDATVEVTPAPTDPDADQDTDTEGVQQVAAGNRTTVVTLTAVGADPVRILFTTTIVAADGS